jgi:hypothetical protein
MAAATELVKQALLVYSFAPIYDGTPEEGGWVYLRAQWQACAALGMTEPLDGTGTPVAFPAAPPEAGPLRLLAFARHPSESMLYSAFLFAEHDTVGLVAAIAPNDQDPRMRSWDQLVQAWRRGVGVTLPPAGLLGEVIVLTGLAGMASPLARFFGAGSESVDDSVRKAAIAALGQPWESAAVTASGIRVYGFARADPAARGQTYCLMAEQSAVATLDQWAWARQGYWGLAPFTRLCLHAAKLSYEEAVHRAAKSVSAATAQIDSAVVDIVRTASGWTEASPVQPRELLAMDTHLRLLQQQLHGLGWSVTRLRDLRETVNIALSNLRRYLPEVVARVGDADDPFTQLVDRATLLGRQIDHDINYLQDLQERARAAHEYVRLLVDHGGRQRSERLTLLQTSVIGALLTALATIQALTYKVPLAAPVQGPVIAMLGAVAFALPVALARWTGTLSRSVPYRWPDQVATGLIGLGLGWFAVSVAWWYLDRHAPTPWPVSAGAAVVGGLLVTGVAALLIWGRDRRDRGSASAAPAATGQAAKTPVR